MRRSLSRHKLNQSGRYKAFLAQPNGSQSSKPVPEPTNRLLGG